MKDIFFKKSFISSILLLAVSGIILKIFVFGEPIDSAQAYCTTSVYEQSLELEIAAKEAGVALRGWKFEQDGVSLLVSARKVPVSPLFNKGDYKTIIDLESVDRIVFGGQEIWTIKD